MRDTTVLYSCSIKFPPSLRFESACRLAVCAICAKAAGVDHRGQDSAIFLGPSEKSAKAREVTALAACCYVLVIFVSDALRIMACFAKHDCWSSLIANINTAGGKFICFTKKSLLEDEEVLLIRLVRGKVHGAVPVDVRTSVPPPYGSP